ncbi:MAG: protease modulator HflC, partial [Candidatus Omnitrophica bacterium]|nr:protease modulator HflC [Candidatus Omnitrophota bacterium]
MPRQLTLTALMGAAAVLLVALMGNPFYIVREGTQAVITRFGDPVSGAITEAGLHVKLPFIENVNRFDERLLEWDGDPNQIPTKDKRFIWIDTTARWRIVDPLKFLQSVGNEVGAQARLDDIIDAATRDVITEQPLIEIVRSSNRDLTRNMDDAAGEASALIKVESIREGRNALTREILSRARQKTPLYGIDLV